VKNGLHPFLGGEKGCGGRKKRWGWRRGGLNYKGIVRAKGLKKRQDP